MTIIEELEQLIWDLDIDSLEHPNIKTKDVVKILSALKNKYKNKKCKVCGQDFDKNDECPTGHRQT